MSVSWCQVALLVDRACGFVAAFLSLKKKRKDMILVCQDVWQTSDRI